MKVVLKRVLIAAVLVAVCAAILAATKAYGVWVISGIAGVLFLLGLLRRETSPRKDGETPDEGGEAVRNAGGFLASPPPEGDPQTEGAELPPPAVTPPAGEKVLKRHETR